MLEVNQLSRRYGDKVALAELSMKVSPGEVVGFLGPNGAGKTTAMRAVLGITRPDSGELLWTGEPIGLSTRQRFGYMPEERGLYNTMIIIEQLVYLGRLHGMTKNDAFEAGSHWLNELGVSDRHKDRLDSLSLGNQQRVQMAAALVHSPDLLVLDEPFSGLDPTGIEALSAILKQRASEGAAVVFSSHQLDLVEHLCERVVIVHNGTDVITGTVEELLESADMIGAKVSDDPEQRWAQAIPGTSFQGVDSGVARIRLREGTSASAVLDLARAAGEVKYFAFERKKLSELFREAVQT